MKDRDLMVSIQHLDLDGVQSLLAAGVPADGSRRRRFFAPQEPTPLLCAVRTGMLEMVACLLDHGANPNLETRKWMPPLALACQQGDRPIAEVLIEHGARVNPFHSSHPAPIETAAWYGREDLVALLLERGADPDAVFARGIASLTRISRPILARLIEAGAHAPQEVEMLVKKGKW